MSVKGLEQSERIARGTQAKVKQTLDRTAEEVKAEIDKLQYLLSDRQAARQWASSPANAEKLAQIRSRMNEVEQLYMDAGDTEAARIFRRRTEAALKQRLTNLKAAELDVTTIMAKGRQQGEAQVLSGLTEVRREGAVGEMYNQARRAGGFFVNFGRPYLNDVVTLQTKAAGSKTIGKYMADMYTRYEAQIKDVFVNGIVRGDSYEMMEEGLANATGLSKRKSELIIRTEANAIFNESIKDVIQDNPLVKGYRFRAVLDSKTSKICQQHDGEYIPKDKIEPGVNFPPLHPNCRSTVTTVLVDEDEKVDTMQRYTKNGRNQWEKVPPGMTYQEYRDKFGFANSKNPRTYNPETRDIHDKTLARITVPQYKGYVKPSRSATARIQKMLEAYRDGDEVYVDCLKVNTGFDNVAKALARQAQAESGFDGLPLQQTSEQFNKTVEKNGYRVLWRQFRREEDAASFLEGDGLYGTGSIHFGAGTYAFKEAPTNEDYGRTTLRMALKSPEEKILKFVGEETDKDIWSAQTPDARINEALKGFQPAERRNAFAALAVEYGYDAVDVQSVAEGTNYTVVLNRTALIVESPQVEETLSAQERAVEERAAVKTLNNKVNAERGSEQKVGLYFAGSGQDKEYLKNAYWKEDEDRESAKRVEETISKLLKEYPVMQQWDVDNQRFVELDEGKVRVGSYDNVKRFLSTKQRERAQNSALISGEHWVNPQTGEYIVGVNTEFMGKRGDNFGDFQEGLARRKEKRDAGATLYTTVLGNSPEAVAIHEWGHAIAEYVDTAMVYGDESPAMEYWNWYKSLDKADIAKQLSEYATEDRWEFEAECFSEIVSGNPSEIAKKYWRYVEKCKEFLKSKAK